MSYITSRVSRVDVILKEVQLPNDSGPHDETPTALAQGFGATMIIGNWLINHNKVTLINRDSETFIIAAPVEVEGQAMIHLAIGSESRQLGHLITREGLELIIENLKSMLAIAEMEQR